MTDNQIKDVIIHQQALFREITNEETVKLFVVGWGEVRIPTWMSNVSH